MPFYENKKLSIDFETSQVICSGQNIKLTRKEFDLLKKLVKNAGRVITRHNLLEEVWGYFGDGRTLDVYIRRLRQN